MLQRSSHKEIWGVPDYSYALRKLKQKQSKAWQHKRVKLAIRLGEKIARLRRKVKESMNDAIEQRKGS